MTMCSLGHRAQTLTEILVGMMVIVILLSGAYRVLSLHSIGRWKAQQSTIALFSLESARNMLLREWESQDGMPSLDHLQALLQTRFPDLTIQVNLVTTDANEVGFRLTLTFPRSTWGRSQSFFREVFRP